MHRGRKVGWGVGPQSHHQWACGDGNIESLPAPGAAQGLMLVEDGSDLRGQRRLDSCAILRRGHEPALGIEDSDVCAGSGPIQTGDLLQSGEVLGISAPQMGRQKPGFAGQGLLGLGAERLLHHLAQ